LASGLPLLEQVFLSKLFADPTKTALTDSEPPEKFSVRSNSHSKMKPFQQWLLSLCLNSAFECPSIGLAANLSQDFVPCKQNR
jgi:hypothetical protein